MAKLAIQLPLVFTIFLVLVFHTLLATSSEVEDEHEFSYDIDAENGPERWGELHPEWYACGNGTMQSPIDLLNERVKVVHHLGRLNRSYKPANATLVNRGHDIMLRWEGDAGVIRINKTEYALQQCHWHSPSEHTLNGDRFAAELHMVHESHDGKVAVVGIMYKNGRTDSFLASLKDHLATLAGGEKNETAVGVVDPREIKIGSRQYYRYIGSLTTPPCTENVLWTIVKKVRTVTRAQVRSLRVAAHDESNSNARPVQALNDRLVELYKPEVYRDN